MKALKFITCLLITAALLLFFSCSTISLNGSIAADDPTPLFKLIVAAIVAIYELIIRLIPTVGNWSLLHWIISTLSKLSGALNVQKKQ